MCFQGFANCSCGHIRLLETACELAAGIPFYIKVACPNYSFKSTKTRQACGVGTYYCREIRIGQFLEKVHRIVEQTKVKLSKIDAQSAPVDVQAAKFTKSADDAGVSQEARRLHSAYHYIFGTLQTLERQRTQVTEQRMVALTVIQEGIKYYHIRAAHARKGDGSAPPPFTLPASLRSRLPAELQTQLAALATPNIVVTSAVTAEVIDVSNDRQDQGDQLKERSPESDNIYVTPKKLTHPARDQQETPDVVEQRQWSAITQSGDFGGILSERKHGGRVKRLIEQNGTRQLVNMSNRKGTSMKRPSLINEGSSVRRSARVRNTKVNYAESEASTIHSREVSPEKSDGDIFSPPKSDVSTSPERKVIRRRPKVPELKKEASEAGDSKLGRSNTTLSSLIDEWSRSTDAARNPFPSAQQRVLGGTGMGYHPQGQVNAGLSTINNSPVNNRTPSLVELPGGAQSDASLTEPVANTSPGRQPLSRHEFLTPNPYDRSSSSNMGMQPLSGTTNYLPNTPGPVSVPSYQYGMYASRAIGTGPPNTPYQSGQFQTTPAQQSVNRTWLISTPAFNSLTELAAAQRQGDNNYETSAPLERNDSALGTAAHSGPTGAKISPYVDLDYDRLRRSFTANAELTPPASVDLTSTNTDPKKRSLPASSPLPSNKRIRLSLPGEDSRNMYGLPFISSPERMSSHDSPTGDKEREQPPMAPEEELPVTPAPILAPTAVMYVPSQNITAGESTDFATTAGSLVEPNNEGGAADGADNQFSDIDWSLINDDIF